MKMGDLVYHPCQHGHLELVRDLLRTGRVEVNRTTKYGYTALEIAALNGHQDVVELLVKVPLLPLALLARRTGRAAALHCTALHCTALHCRSTRLAWGRGRRSG
jgi:ankyrin repeat protein